MRLKKKVLGTLMTLAMIFSLLPMSASAASNKVFTIDDVSYDGTADTSTELFSTITSITYTDKGIQTTLTVPADKLASLTVDNVQYDITADESFSYSREAVINFTAKDTSNHENTTGPGVFLLGGLAPTDSIDYYFRAAAFITNGTLKTDYSISNAIKSGTITNSSAEDVVIDSKGSFFNGFFIADSNYTIDGLDMTLLGNGGDDFSGWGAGVTVKGTGSNVDITNAKISSTGVIRTAIWAGGTNSKVNITNSVITAFGGDSTGLTVPMLIRVPWVLGMEGNMRATNVLGSATANYSDSIVVSEEWGALSTDSGVEGTNALNVSNVLSGIGYLEEAVTGKTYDAIKEVNGITYGFTMANSGYVTYADAGVYNNYDNVEFYAPDYAIVIASKSSSANFTGRDTVVKTNRIGAMWHQNQDGTLHLTDGSWTVDDTMFLVKSGSNTCFPNLIVDGTELNITGTDNYSGVLYQLMDSDDAGGPFITKGYTIPSAEADWSSVTEVPEETTAADTSFININTVGDIYNSIYTLNQDLNVTLDSSKLVGVISSSNANHVNSDGSIVPAGTTIDLNDNTSYLFSGRITNTASKAVNNDVNLVLSNGTEWVVDGTSYLTTLAIDDTSNITAPEGYNIVLTTNGTEISVAAGTYTNAVVSIVSADSSSTGGNGSITNNIATVLTSPAKTGDTASYLFWIITAGIAAVSTAGYVIYYKKAKKYICK